MKKLLIMLTLLVSWQGFAQNKYLVVLKDKANSPYTITNPSTFLSARAIQRRIKQNIAITERDLPPNPSYLTAIRNTGATILYKSRWLNGVLIETNPTTLSTILALPFVKGLEGQGDIREASLKSKNKLNIASYPSEITDNGLSQNQLAMLGADKMHQKGFRGEGMMIGVLDSGFLNVNQLSFFNSLFTENRILGTWDFVNNEANVYNDNNHGTHVLSCMAAYTDGQIVGTAYKASYLLLKTEDVASETKLEEANWLFGAEMADSVGVDVINSSLNYTTFTNSAQNYQYADMNGDKALSTRAADWAAQTGIVVVVAAGNEGNDAWKYIGSPADADSVIAVGAVNSIGDIASFSSFGPSADGRIKPELSAQGLNTTIGTSNGAIAGSSGTSFASPLMAGFVASFWQAFPKLTAMQVRNFLIRSASLYKTPNDRLGYGIPNFEKAFQLATVLDNLQKTGKEVAIFPNPINDSNNINVWILKEDAGENYTYQLIDITGRTVWTFTSTEAYATLPIKNADFAVGRYILKVTASNLNFTSIVMKQ